MLWICAPLALVPWPTRFVGTASSVCGDTACRTRVPLAQQLSDDAIADRMAKLRSKKTRRAARGSQQQPRTAPATPEPLVLQGDESCDVPVWPVPDSLRMPGAQRVVSHGFHASLAETFPDSGLAEAWDTNSALRTDLRKALRADLFTPPASWSEKQVCGPRTHPAAVFARRAAGVGRRMPAQTERGPLRPHSAGRCDSRPT